MAEKWKEGIAATGAARMTACGKNLYMFRNNTRST